MSGDEHEASTMSRPAPALAAFEDALHSSFVVRDGDRELATLTLGEIKAGGSRRGWESFSLIFDGPNPPPFRDGLFEVEHPGVGVFALFLVAVHTDGDAQQYEAVFNRPRPDRSGPVLEA